MLASGECLVLAFQTHWCRFVRSFCHIYAPALVLCAGTGRTEVLVIV